MLYFENLPIIDYDYDNTEQTAKMRNIFFNLNLSNMDPEYLQYYRIDGYKRLEDISFELYGTTNYWWLLALVNDIKDFIFDLPIHEEILQSVAAERTVAKYGSLVATGAVTYYGTQLDELVLENDEKRLILIISNAYIGKIITEILKSL